MEYKFNDLETPSEYMTQWDKIYWQPNRYDEARWPSQGKCDLRDDLCMIGVKEGQTVDEHLIELIEKTDFNVGQFVLKSNKITDVLPYMFSLVSGGFSKERNYIDLSNKPWLDIEEHQMLMLRAERVFKFFKYVKAHNLSNPTFEQFMEWNKEWESSWDSDEKNKMYKVMFDRYYEFNYKHNEHREVPKDSMEDLIESIHTSWKNRCREDLLDFCIGAGCDPNHPMLRKYRADVADHYVLMNGLMGKSYSETSEFYDQLQEQFKKRGWIK